MILASCSSFSGAITAGPLTSPLVPAVQEFVLKVSALAVGSTIRPDQGPRLKPTGNSPHFSSLAFSIPKLLNRSRVHSQAFWSPSELVRRDPIRFVR